MPELPEVETVTRSLKEVLIDQKILDVKVIKAKSFPQGMGEEIKKNLIGKSVVDARRRAKFIDLELSNNYHLVTHLKMTGQLIYVGDQQQAVLAGGGHPTQDWRQQLPGKHTRIIYTLSKGKLFFNDQRIFGWMKLVTAKELKENMYANLGPDANSEIVTAEYLHEKLVRKRIPIKQSLMDNRIWCGLGNIYAAEALFRAQISPWRPSNEVSEAELKEVVEVTRKILAEAIESGGTTFDGKYVNARGEQGTFVEKLEVYGREGLACVRCGGELQKVKLGGRSTVFCPICQK